jgi:hypothetical protein
MIYRYRGAHFHSLKEENGIMTYFDACDCGCQNFRGEVHEGDTLITSHGLGLRIQGDIKNITIIASKIRFYGQGSLENVQTLYLPYEEIDQLYPRLK